MTGAVTAPAAVVPRRRSSFVGRDADVAALLARLDGAAAVTLVGVGGVGKTSLAFAVAARLEQISDTVVHVVELASTRDSAAVARVVADSLGLPATSERTPEEVLVQLLCSEGRTLLVLDNCEQTVDGVVALVDELLDRCRQLTVLATSRVALGFEGEHVWPVQPLAVYTDVHGNAPAIQLLVDRATASHPDAVAAVDPDDLVALAQRLDGVPLALELAAARLGSMGILELTRRLDEELLALDTTRRDAHDRHRSLAAVVEWSYRLLSPDEQHLAVRLSVFRGSFTRDAAAEVVGAPMTASFERLVNSSLLAVSERTGVARFQMLEMIREFLATQLDASGTADEVRTVYARWAARIASASAQELRTAAEKEAVRRFAAEEANVGAALEWALERDDTELITALVRGLHDHVIARAGREVHAWVERAADHVWDRPDAGDVVVVAATAAMARGDIPRYRALLEQAFALGATGRELLVSRDVDWAGVLVFEGRVEEALQQARTEPDLPDDPWLLGYSLVRRAMPFAYAGMSQDALALADRALGLAVPTGNPTLQGWARYVRGEALMGLDPRQAIESYHEAVALARGVDNTFLEGLLSVALASALGRHGEPVESLQHFRDTIARWHDAGAWSFLSTTLRNFGEFLVRIERYEDAVLVRCAVEFQEHSSLAGGVDADRDRFLRQQFIDRLGRQRFEELVHKAHQLDPDELVDLATRVIEQELQARRSVTEFRVVVFTDLERSTELLVERKDIAARVLMREYDVLTATTLERHKGEKIKGTGDGTLATFRSVADALRCVTELLRGVDEAVSNGVLPRRLRVGMHAGETMWDDEDVYGTIVNIAARVVDRADGGEVVVTDTVRQIALGADYEFTRLGEQALKGIPEPVGLHQLEWRTDPA